MAPRNSGKSDDEIIMGAVRARGKHGARFTLAHVAREVSLTPARMVQRFGSRQRLLQVERLRLILDRAVATGELDRAIPSSSPARSSRCRPGPISSGPDTSGAI